MKKYTYCAIVTALALSILATSPTLSFQNNNSSINNNSPEDYEDVLCNGWIYNLVSAFKDSCLLDTTSLDTLLDFSVDINLNGIDTTIIIEYDIMVYRVTKTCYDRSFGVLEKFEEFEGYYLRNIVTDYELLENEIAGTLNGTPVPLDSLNPILEQTNLIVPEVIIGFKTDVLIDCGGLITSACINDTACYNSINDVWIFEENQTLVLATIGTPPDMSLDYHQLWNYTEQNHLICNYESPRVNPCDTCSTEFVRNIKLLPDSCEESTLSIIIDGSYDYEYCSLQNVIVDQSFNSIYLNLNFERADTFEFCSNCGEEFSDTVLIGNLDDGTYDIVITNSGNDSTLFTASVEILNCVITPPCFTIAEQNLFTQILSDTSSLLQYVGNNSSYISYQWQIRNCDSLDWIDLGSTSDPEILVDNLIPEETYCWRVRGICLIGNPGWSVITIFVSNDPFTNIEQFTAFNKIEVFPNPSKGNIHIKIEEGFHVKNLGLYDVKGQLIQAFNLESFSWSIYNLEPGMYILKGNGENLNFSEKVVVF